MEEEEVVEEVEEVEVEVEVVVAPPNLERVRAVLLVPAAVKMHSLSPTDEPEPVLRALVKSSELSQDRAAANIQGAEEAAVVRL